MAIVKELEAKIAELERQNEELKGKADEPQTVILQDLQHKQMVHYEPRKKVTIELFKDDYRYKEPLFVGINGRTFLIPRGQPVELDDYVAQFVEDQKSEEARIMRRVEAEERDYNKLTSELGS